MAQRPPCRNCGERPAQPRKPRCYACHSYWTRWHQDRPLTALGAGGRRLTGAPRKSPEGERRPRQATSRPRRPPLTGVAAERAALLRYIARAERAAQRTPKPAPEPPREYRVTTLPGPGTAAPEPRLSLVGKRYCPACGRPVAHGRCTGELCEYARADTG